MSKVIPFEQPSYKDQEVTFMTSAGFITGKIKSIDSFETSYIYNLENVLFNPNFNMNMKYKLNEMDLCSEHIIGQVPCLNDGYSIQNSND